MVALRLSLVPALPSRASARTTKRTTQRTANGSIESTAADIAALQPARRSHDTLVVRGAREHNLKDISVELPRDSLILSLIHI